MFDERKSNPLLWNDPLKMDSKGFNGLKVNPIKSQTYMPKVS